jgi:putative transposase
VPASNIDTLRPRPANSLTCPEAAQVVSVIRSASHADQSCRELALTLAEKTSPISVSHTCPDPQVLGVTVWRYQNILGCNGPRGRQLSQRSTAAPDTEWITGPNQLWDWDVTWLRTPQRYEFLYLYSLLDHFSRKSVAWQVCQTLCSTEVQSLWDAGLLAEGILDQPHDRWPKSLSDRGAQMRSYSTRQYFAKLGIDQLFSRPRHPNDNPRIEAHFGAIKTHTTRALVLGPIYPAYFADAPVVVAYFHDFYIWYNTRHPLTTLKMLTPEQVHSGQAAGVLATRHYRKHRQHLLGFLYDPSVPPHNNDCERSASRSHRRVSVGLRRKGLRRHRYRTRHHQASSSVRF